jgi:putative drug exporter of the RND superfamily
MGQKKGMPKWATAAIAGLFVVFWLGMAGIGGPYFGKISEVSSTDLTTFLPESAEATKVNEELKKFRDSQSIPAIIIFDKSGKVLTEDQKTEINKLPEKLKDVEGINGKISPPVHSEDGKAAFIIVPLQSDGDFKTIFPELRQDLKEANLPVDYKLTGPASLARDLQGAFGGIDGTLLVVALTVVFLILLIVYRSLFLPIIVLLISMSALAAAIFVVYYLAKADIVQMNGQVQGILFILTIGATTDYSLLYISRYKEELRAFKDSWQATKAALRASWEPIVAAGGTVALAVMCLFISDLGSNKALGPVGAIGIVMSVISALTFLPAVLLLLGRVSFWPRIPKFDPDSSPVAFIKQYKFWSKVGLFVLKRSRPIWIFSLIFLAAASHFILQLKAEGVPQSNLIVGYSEAREGQKILDRHFAAGSGSPAYIIARQAKAEEVTAAIEANKGVDSVSIMATNSPSGSMPIGGSKAKIKTEILKEVVKEREKQVAEAKAAIEKQLATAPAPVRDQAVKDALSKIPNAKTIADQAYPFKDAKAKVIDGEVVLQATLTDAADSLEARQTVVELRDAVRKADSSAIVGGTSAIQYDTNTASNRDLRVIIPAILLAITIVLMLLLRALVAPIVLLVTTVLSFGATLGIAALLFNHLWHFPGADPSVVIFGFVFLVALGIDYNIFLMTRVREETLKLGVKKGTIKGLVVTGGVITSAGVVLAATFASLSVIPILFLGQVAFIVAFGVLLDTILVRSLLVPSLTLELGKKMWWPSRKIPDKP